MHGIQLSFDSIPVQPEPLKPRRAVLSRQRAAAHRDNALARVEKHADADWKETAIAAVKTAAETNARFTTDTVIAILAETDARTHEPRALGPVMMSAARMGWIVATAEFVKSAAVSRHCAMKRVWQSQLYPSEVSQ